MGGYLVTLTQTVLGLSDSAYCYYFRCCGTQTLTRTKVIHHKVAIHGQLSDRMIPRIIVKCRFILLSVFLGVFGLILIALLHHGKSVSVLSQGPALRTTLYANNDLHQKAGDKYDGGMVNRQLLAGTMFFDSNDVVRFSKPVTTSVVHSFSTDTIKAVRRIFQDFAGDNMFRATVPALIRRNGVILLVQRIWLSQYEHAAYYNKNLNWTNYWQENFFYTQTFDENYQPLSKGELMGIPSPTNLIYEYRSDGPMDPRLFSVKDDTFVIFHTWASYTKGNPKKTASRLHLWNFQENAKIRLDTTDLKLMTTEINWCPVVRNDTLYLLYTFDPLRVLQCNHGNGNCKLVHSTENADQHSFEHVVDHLRGGTPFVEYTYPYFISFAHSVLVTTNSKSVYTMHLVVISVEPVFRIVYVSAPVDVSKELLYSVPIVRNFTLHSPFVYPVGIIMWTKDLVDIGAHLNDFDGHVIRFRGIQGIMDKVIIIDQLHETKHGARARQIQAEVAKSVDIHTEHKLTFQGVNVG